MRYVKADMDAANVTMKSQITQHMLQYALDNFEEITEGAARQQGVSLSCKLVEWYLKAFGIFTDLGNEIENLRYVYPTAWSQGSIASTGDIVVIDPQEFTVAIVGIRNLVSYNEALREPRSAARLANRYPFVLSTYNTHPRSMASLPEQVYEQCKAAYSVRSV